MQLKKFGGVRIETLARASDEEPENIRGTGSYERDTRVEKVQKRFNCLWSECLIIHDREYLYTS